MMYGWMKLPKKRMPWTVSVQKHIRSALSIFWYSRRTPCFSVLFFFYYAISHPQKCGAWDMETFFIHTNNAVSRSKSPDSILQVLLAFSNTYQRKKHSVSLLGDLRLSQTDVPPVYPFLQQNKQRESWGMLLKPSCFFINKPAVKV